MMSQYKPEVKREMLLGDAQALDQYSEMLYRTYLFDRNPELATFTQGGRIDLPHDVSESAQRIKTVLKHIYTKYIRELLFETHDEVLLQRMAQGNVLAIKVYQPEKAYPEMADCGVKGDNIHAYWLVNTPRRSGYFLTTNYDQSEDGNDAVSQKTIERIDSEGTSQFLDFFEYDPETGLFVKHQENTWGGRELARNIQFSGMISPEFPITPKIWFSNVLRNLEAALAQEVQVR